MGWSKLLSQGRVTREPPSKTELDNLRSIVRRSLSDVAATGLSDDARFVLAYDAARTLSLIVVRAEGYRPKSKGGYHGNTFLALEAADPAFAALSGYFDGCRTKRNVSEYDYAGGVSATDADSLLKEVQQFSVRVAAWVKTRHPSLVWAAFRPASTRARHRRRSDDKNNAPSTMNKARMSCRRFIGFVCNGVP